MTSASRTDRRSRNNLPVTYRVSLITLFTLLLLGGCSGEFLPGHTYQSFYGDRNYLTGTNYLTFEHAFTDAGAADAKRRADSQCAQRKQMAVKTEDRCTLQSCITSFQCMKPEDAEKYQAQGGR